MAADILGDLQYYGIGNALLPYLIHCIHENGVGIRNLELMKSVTAKYIGSDLILDLNDDTAFEIALNQLARPFAYAPISRKNNVGFPVRGRRCD